MKKEYMTIILIIAIIMLASCGIKKNKKSEKEAQVVVYYEANNIEECQQQLSQYVKKNYNILSEEYKNLDEDYNDFAEKYEVDDEVFDELSAGKIIIEYIIVIGNVENEFDVEKIRKDIYGLNENVRKVIISYPLKKSDEKLDKINMTTSEKYTVIEDEMILSFIYNAESEEECENEIGKYLRSNYCIKSIGYSNFTEDMNSYNDNNNDEVAIVPEVNQYVCIARIGNIENESDEKKIISDIEENKNVSQISSIYPIHEGQ